MRLLELRSGEIRLDGIDISQVSLQPLRQRCFITASQDALLLPNETLRFNLDPEMTASDETLMLALEKLGLWSHFDSANIATVEGLDNASDPDQRHELIFDQNISTFPAFSSGQSQLFSLSRALVKLEVSRRAEIKPVVLLDELNSSLDSTTESAIHRIIDEEFTRNGNTVIMVTHRIGNLEKYLKIGRDKFVVLRDGRIDEIIEDWGARTLHRIDSSS